jgi:signal transduction histidine kinase
MRWNLATKFSATILGVVALAILSSLMTFYGAWRVNVRLKQANQENLPRVRAEEAEIALAEGNKFMAIYLADRTNPSWEQDYRAAQQRFQNWFETARNLPHTSKDERAILRRLEGKWAELDAQRDRVLALCKQGELDKAKTLLREIDGRLSSEIRGLCDQLISLHEGYANDIMSLASGRIQKTTWVVGISGALTLLLGGLLLWLFFSRVLVPLRGMVAEVHTYRGSPQEHDKGAVEDELRMMGGYLRVLMSEVSDTRSRLERSRDRLLAAEKLASVGKLAASVAHEIRNPLTAMKMWLFSINEMAQGNKELVRRLGIVSEEILRLEHIVRDFLEFSRPSALQRCPQDVGTVLDETLKLLEPRLQGGKVRVNHAPRAALPQVMVDAGQLKQVFINLLGNAADAMPRGGEIQISAAKEANGEGQPMVVVRIGDTGGGVPRDIQPRIFEPFFSTKETGTGLGLSIAAQVMARHGGALVLESSTEKGTIFAVWLPLAPKDTTHGQDSPR